MRTTIFAGIFGIFFTIVVIGALSVSPILDSDKGAAFLSSVFDQVLPEPKLEEPIIAKFTAKETQEVRATPTPQTRVLGSTTTAQKVSLATLYGLINGSRSDKQESTLLVSRELEMAAETMLMGNEIAPNGTVQELAPDERVLQTSPVFSDWEVLKQLQQDPRQELLMHSSVFTQMGGAVFCDAMTAKCSTLFILGTH